MIDGLYAAASGMNAQQSRMDSIAVDLSNLNTIGYKSQHFGFEDLLYRYQGANRAVLAGNTGSGVAGGVVDRAMTQGALQGTQNPLDLAIQGSGFFQVRLGNGNIGLTRAGNFGLDAQRRLSTSEGNLVVPTITIPNNIPLDSVTIGPDGRVSSGSQNFGRIQLVNVPAPQRLTSLGGNLYAPNANSGPISNNGIGIVRQRSLEESNADASQSLTDMIQAQRAYDLCSRAVRTWDEMLQTANQIRR